jgi:hypothetical protein
MRFFSELRTLLAFFEVTIPDLCSLLSVASYIELTGTLTKMHLKCARGSGGAEIRSEHVMQAMAIAKQILHLLSPWRILNALLLKILVVRCKKRLKTRSRGLGRRFRKM